MNDSELRDLQMRFKRIDELNEWLRRLRFARENIGKEVLHDPTYVHGNRMRITANVRIELPQGKSVTYAITNESAAQHLDSLIAKAEAELAPLVEAFTIAGKLLDGYTRNAEVKS